MKKMTMELNEEILKSYACLALDLQSLALLVKDIMPLRLTLEHFYIGMKEFSGEMINQSFLQNREYH